MDVEDVQETRLREKLANNNKLWLVCLLVLVVATVYYTQRQEKSYSRTPIATVKLGKTAKGTYNDAEHVKLAEDIVKMARKRGLIMTAQFVDTSHFNMIVPKDTATDELSYLSRFVATAIYRRFGNVSIIYVYAENKGEPNGKDPQPVAVTRWSERERNFLVRLQRSTEIE